MSFSGCEMLREDSERKLLELGVQAGAVSHHAKNLCAVWDFRGDTGARTAVLVDCGRVSLGPKVAPCRSFVFVRPCCVRSSVLRSSLKVAKSKIALRQKLLRYQK